MRMNLKSLLELERKGDHEKLARLIHEYSLLPEQESPVSHLNLSIIQERINKHRLSRSNTGAHTTTSKLAERLEVGDRVGIKTWTAIITMWKRLDYIKEQLEAIRNQSISPVEIVIILNDSYISERSLRDIIGENVKIVKSDINSLYTRWALSYIAMGEYVCVFDDDVIPGQLWIANAIRACDNYNALVGPSGRIYDPNGRNGYFKYVGPLPNSTDENTVDCGETDIYCDWVCNSYLFKREWAHHAISARRYQDSSKTFDDIQLATSLFLHGGIRCIAPMQPAHNTKLHGSLKHEYGNDGHAIWKTNSEQHFKSRKAYIESLIDDIYIPVKDRDNLYRIHLIVPFGDRKYLNRCLASISGQTYRNYTCTLIDDCCDGNDSLADVRALGLDKKTVRYIRATTRLHPLRAREIATDLLDANPADIVVHLDGDDWFPYPDVLDRINAVYRAGRTYVTYGNAICVRDLAKTSFNEFASYEMSTRWNVMQQDGNSPIIPITAISKNQLNGDWRNAPWSAMHLRTFLYVKWLEHPRNTFHTEGGKYAKVATDAAIFLPILNNTSFDKITFIPEITYVYQNAGNTIHSKSEITDGDRDAVKKVIREADRIKNVSAVDRYLICDVRKVLAAGVDFEVIADYRQIDNATKPLASQSPKKAFKSAVVTVVTPNYIADGIISVLSYCRAVQRGCRPYIFIASTDHGQIALCHYVFQRLGISILTPYCLEHTRRYSETLIDKYGDNSDEYRWAMKGVCLTELLEKGADLAVFVDPDTYAVSTMKDIHDSMRSHPISVFPHFRDPDHEYLRKVLYKDGFFNGGMFAATSAGKGHLLKLYERCLHEMTKDPVRSRWDDQKYFDLFTLEVTGLNVNHDRGVNYNPWNYEPVEGLISPSQRSYLLKSGYFVRHWHVSTMMIKNSIELKEEKYAVYRPIVQIYLETLLLTNVLLSASLSLGNQGPGVAQILGLADRVDRISSNSMSLRSGESVNRYLRLFAEAGNLRETEADGFLSNVSGVLKESVLFDNYGLILEFIGRIFGDHHAKQYFSSLISSDLTHLTDEVICSADFSKGVVNARLQDINYGEVIKSRLATLRSSGITY